MMDIVERLRDDQPGERQWVREARMDLWDLLMDAAHEIEKLRAENENLRKTIRDGIKLIDLDAVKSFRKTLKWALGEKE
jgi:DNA-binding SARP family transcriptional activator